MRLLDRFHKEKKPKISQDELVDLIHHMAVSGDGTDECLKRGCLPVPVHFYQPIPDIEELERRKVWDKVSKLSGIDFKPEKYLAFLEQLSEKYAQECKWPEEPTDNPKYFYLNNNCFSYGCASALHCIIRDNKPKRIIEIGSGNSSKIINAALQYNKTEGYDTEYTIIDPYSEVDLNNFQKNTTLIKEPVETMNPEFFTKLEENDILFIDSSHACKIGSDVNFEILEVLPLLNKGVIIHFHDIDLPYEYSKVYATTPTFRMFWTESYLLQAFLSCNKDFEIILPMRYMQCNYEDLFRRLFPHGNNIKNWHSGSFWIKRITK